VLRKLRTDARAIIDACLQAVDPEAAVRRYVSVDGNDVVVAEKLRLPLREIDRIFVVGAGKGTAPMAKAVEDIMGDRISAGAICVKYGHGLPLHRIRVFEGGHPLPDAAGQHATQEIMDLIRQAGPQDLIISCISGGGSALLPAPVPPATLADKQALTDCLLACGATIHEINTLRKHLSLSKGGNLMKLAYPARVVNLMLSDVVGDDMDTIASGPFVPDATTYQDALKILEHYDLLSRVPASVLRHYQEGANGSIPETPKPGDPIFEKALNVIVGSNIQALCAGREKAKLLGYFALVLSSTMEGHTAELARTHAAIARETGTTGNPVSAPACILSGGETTVVIKGTGLGGRNQEFALNLVNVAAQIPNSLFVSIGTDGTDGPTDAAGAMVDSETLARARAMGLDPEEFAQRSDSYHFFQQLGDLVITGPTRTNVMDVRICLVG
jgi:hydroxypyruvate reductase